MELETQPEKKQPYIPSSFLILFGLTFLVILISLLASPWGTIQPLGYLDIFAALWHGFIGKAGVILFILSIGGTLGVMTHLKAIDAGINALIKKLNGKESLLIIGLTIIFGLGGTSYGMWEETIPFFAILIPIFIKAGYGPLFAIMLILVGAGTGALASTVNPFAVGAAVEAINGVTTTAQAGATSTVTAFNNGDGIAMRVVNFIFFEAIAISALLYYAKQHKKLGGNLEGVDQEEIKKRFPSSGDIEFTTKRKISLGIFVASFLLMIFFYIPWGSFLPSGAVEKFNQGWGTYMLWLGSSHAWEAFGDWGFVSPASLFLMSTIIIFAINYKEFIFDGKNCEENFISIYVNGARDMLGVCLLIAAAGGLAHCLDKSQLGTTIATSVAFMAKPNMAAVWAIVFYLVALVLCFMMPSTSGFGTAFFGIFATAIAADGNWSDPQKNKLMALTILIFIIASGIVNLSCPTSAALVSYINLAGVSYVTWLKHVWKLIVVYLIAGFVIIMIGAGMIHWTNPG